MTIQDLFNEYVSVSKDYQVSGIRQQQIIQEAEALVRKETIEEIMELKTSTIYDNEVIYLMAVEYYAQSKGITL